MDNMDNTNKNRSIIENVNYPYHPPKEGIIPIVAYNPTPWFKPGYTFPPTVSAFEKIIECGFNCAMMDTTPAPTPNGEGMNPGLLDGSLASMKDLDIMAVVNAGAFCAVPFPNNNLESSVYRTVMINFINKYKTNPKIWGWMIKDEPTFLNLFGFNDPQNTTALSGQIDVEETYYKYIELSPSKITFFNLACTLRDSVIGEEISNNASKDTALKKYYAYLADINSSYVCIVKDAM